MNNDRSSEANLDSEFSDIAYFLGDSGPAHLGWRVTADLNRAEPRSAILCLPWLLLLPLIGAIGAYMSRQANEVGLQVYLAGTFPAPVIAAILAVIFPFAFFVDKRIAPDFKLGSLAAMTFSWVILPGLALAAGVAFVNRRKQALPTKAGTT
jgi:hypothetical protein